jgi:hypothetical protein
LNKPLR